MANPTALLETSLGTITVELFVDKMPITAGNFVKLAKSGFYDGLHFHRIIDNFMLQFGCPHSRDPKSNRAGTGDGPDGPIKDEHPADAKISNDPGTLSMANAGPNTNGSQFFLISGPSGVGLPPQYNHFGQIVKGLDVLETMQNVPTARGDRPKDDVVINSVSIAVAD